MPDESHKFEVRLSKEVLKERIEEEDNLFNKVDDIIQNMEAFSKTKIIVYSAIREGSERFRRV